MTVPPPDASSRGVRRTPIVVGLTLSAVSAGVAGALTGVGGAVTALAFGLIATIVQLVAGRAMAGAERHSIQVFMKRWGLGMGLRMAGVGLVAAAALVDHPAIPAIPAALAYVGVLIPLLFLEARRFG